MEAGSAQDEYDARGRAFRALRLRLDALDVSTLDASGRAIDRCRRVAAAVGARPSVIAYGLRERPTLRAWVLTGVLA